VCGSNVAKMAAGIMYVTALLIGMKAWRNGGVVPQWPSRVINNGVASGKWRVAAKRKPAYRGHPWRKANVWRHVCGNGNDIGGNVWRNAALS